MKYRIKRLMDGTYSIIAPYGHVIGMGFTDWTDAARYIKERLTRK